MAMAPMVSSKNGDDDVQDASYCPPASLKQSGERPAVGRPGHPSRTRGAGEQAALGTSQPAHGHPSWACAALWLATGKGSNYFMSSIDRLKDLKLKVGVSAKLGGGGRRAAWYDAVLGCRRWFRSTIPQASRQTNSTFTSGSVSSPLGTQRLGN